MIFSLKTLDYAFKGAISCLRSLFPTYAVVNCFLRLLQLAVISPILFKSSVLLCQVFLRVTKINAYIFFSSVRTVHKKFKFKSNSAFLLWNLMGLSNALSQ